MSVHSKKAKSGTSKGHQYAGIKWYYVLLIAAFAVIIYLPSLKNGFTYDDFSLVYDNYFIKAISSVKYLFATDYYMHFKEHSYRPVVSLTYIANYLIAGKQAWSFHLVNLLLSVAASVMIFITLTGITGNCLISFFTALLFTAHPACVEINASIANREDIIVLIMMAAGGYVYSRILRKPGSTGHYLLITAVILCYTIGLFSKETAITFFPAVFALEMLWKYKGKLNLKIFAPKAAVLVPAAAVTVIFLYIRFFLISSRIDTEVTYPASSFLVSVLTIVKVVGMYLRIFIIPVRLNADYIIQHVKTPLNPAFLVSLCAVLLLLASSVYSLASFYRNREKTGRFYYSAGIIWFFITLGPFYNIIPIYILAAERYIYIPFLGLSFSAATLVYELCRHENARRPVLAFFLMVIGAFSFMTVSRVAIWKSELTLWGDTVKVSPLSPRAHHNYGKALMEEYHYPEARYYLEKAISLYPEYDKAFTNLAIIHLLMQDYSTAEACLQRSYSLDSKSYITLVTLGNLYSTRGEYEKGIKYYKAALALDPYAAQAYYNLGNSFLKTGKTEDARRYLIKTLELNEDYGYYVAQRLSEMDTSGIKLSPSPGF